jgi:plasmid stabilization system protein ParE
VTRELILGPEAEADIADARDWYDPQNPGLGADFIHAVDGALKAIQQNLFQYQTVWEQFRRAGIVRFPYALIYRVSDREITVVACFHGRRNPRVWRTRT